MASTARYVSGDMDAQAVLCDPSYPIEVGDLLFQEQSNMKARPASALAQQGSKLLTQEVFHNLFLGVALQKNGTQSNETVPLHSTLDHQPPNTIMVATRGRFRYPLGAVGGASVNGGELIGPSCDTPSTSGAATATLQNQVVEIVTAVAQSIGRARPSPAEIGQTSQAPEGQPPTLESEVVVDIVSQVFHGGLPTPITTSSSGAA